MWAGHDIKNEAEALSDVEYAQNEADEALSKLASATSDAEKREADLTRRIKELETSLQAAKDALRAPKANVTKQDEPSKKAVPQHP